MSDSSSFFARGALHGGSAATGMDTTPQLDLSATWRALTVSGSYAPRLVLANVSGPQDPLLLVMHTGSFALSLHGERSQLELGQYLGVGEQYLGLLPQVASRDALAALDASTSRATLLATTDSLRVLQTTTSLRGTRQWSERTSSGLEAAYAVSGGADAAAEALSPRFETARLASSLDYALSEVGTAALRLASSHIDSSARRRYWISDVLATWSMRWTETLTSSLSGGASWIQRSRGEGAGAARAAPNLSASVVQELERRELSLKLRAGGRLAPFVNSLTAEVQTTTQGSLGANLKIMETELDLSFDASRSLPLDATDSFRVLGASLRAAQGVRDWLRIYGQFRVLEQRTAPLSTALPPQWLVVVGLALAAPRLDL